MYLCCCIIKPLLEHLKNKQIAYNKTIHRWLTQDTSIIIPKFEGIDSELNLNTNNREKRGIFSIITGTAGLAYDGISVYLNWKKNEDIEEGYKAMWSHQNLLKNRLYQVNKELISYGMYI